MPHSIRVYNVVATYTAGTWTCEDDPIQALLESLVDPQEVKKGGSLHELHHAHHAAKKLGGVVLGGPYPELELLDRLEEEAQQKAALERQNPKPARRPSGGLFGLFGRGGRDKLVRE